MNSPESTGFNTTAGYPLPQFYLTMTNRLRFVMVDQSTGRVIDYVQLEGMGGERFLTSSNELEGNDDWGPGGVWDTNRMQDNPPTTTCMGLKIRSRLPSNLRHTPSQATKVRCRRPPTWNAAVLQTEGFNTVEAAATLI